ncbi:MAG: hypothetical protein IH884_08575, partial [Myxococcales bacterium]|nr:hypothetical protein [Myxococcales bacterium]
MIDQSLVSSSKLQRQSVFVCSALSCIAVAFLAADAPPLRRAAATALGQIGDKRAVPVLLRAAGAGGDDFLMHSLVYALIEIGDFDCTLSGLVSKNPLEQHAALVALDQMAPKRLTQKHVAPLLESGDVTLRRTALKIVTSRDGWSDQIIAFLKSWTASKQSKPTETMIARGAIAAFWADKRVQALIRDALVSESTSPATRTAVLESIGRLKQLPKVWIEPMGALLRTKDDTIRLQTIHAIAALGTRKLDGELRKLAADPSTKQSLRAAAWSCVAGGGSPLPRDAFRLLLARITSKDTPPFDRLDA